MTVKLRARLTQEELDALSGSVDWRELYEERDGAFLLSVEPASGEDSSGKKFRFALEDVGGLTHNLGEKTNEVRKLKDRLRPFDNGDGTFLDPVAARAALDMEKDRKDDGDSKHDVQTRIDAAVRAEQAKHEKEQGAATRRNDLLIKQVRKLLVEAKVPGPITELGMSPGMMLPAISSMISCEWDDDAGEVVATVKDEKGDPRYVMQGSAAVPMTPEQLIPWMRDQEEYKGWFPGTGNAGSGAPGEGGRKSGGGNTSQIDEKLSPEEQLRQYRRTQSD